MPRLLGVAALSAALAACATGGEVASRPSATADSYANYLVGRMADLRADHGAASEHYYRALQRAPDDPALIEGAMSAALSAGDLPRARDVAAIAASHNVQTSHTRLLRAADALAAGRWRQARTQLEAGHEGAAEELIARIMLIWARTGAGRIDEATEELSASDLARPYLGLVAYQRALAYDYVGDPELARAGYVQAESGGLWSPPAIERYADLLTRLGQRDEALAMLRRRDERAASPVLADMSARISAGESPSRTRLTPARAAAIGLFGLGTIFVQDSAKSEGLAAFALASVLDPELDAVRVAFAEVQIDLGHADVARASLTQVSADSPYAPIAQALESFVLLREGHEEQAVALARQSAETGSPRATRTLAELYRNLERYEEAEPLFDQLVASDPQDWRLLFARGVSRERLGRWPEAEADFRQALTLSPEQPEVLNYLGYTWVDRGEHLQEALQMIQRAVELRPLSGAIVDSLGWAHFKLGDYNQAVTYLERAVELEPADALLNDHLGDAYWRAGRRIEARFQWQRALSLDPGDEESVAIQNKLADGMTPLPPTRSATR